MIHKMALFRFNRVSSKLLRSRSFATAVIHEDEYASRPEYPPILDLSFHAKIQRKKDSVHEEIKAVKTVEEKQIKLNMPRYYGFKCYMLTDEKSGYNTLDLTQHVTRTHLIQNDNLPEFYNSIDVDKIVSDLKSQIEEIIVTELIGYQHKNAENLTACLARAINRAIINQLSNSDSHLLKVQIDHDPRIESSWYVGGMVPPEHVRRCRGGLDFMKDMIDDPVDRLMVSITSPILSLRSELPLRFITSPSEVESGDFPVPFWKYDPRTIGTHTEFRPIVNTPGFWPGDSHKFGLLSVYRRNFRRTPFEDMIRDDETLKRQGVLSSFSWLQAQANHLGFNTFNDITYPIVTQTIITDGKFWSFFTYQMNTMLLHSHNIDENPKKNICWATNEIKLFDNVEGEKVIGLNEDVLKMLVKFYANAPEQRLGVNLTPYLSNDEKVAADYADDDKREWLEKEYKYLTSARPRHKLGYEIYSWEKIYKIDNKTRFMDKRLRPFERLENPYKRTLDDRLARYIPKKDRPDLPKWKGRRAKEYFP